MGMENISKARSTVSIDKRINDVVVSRLDECDYLHLGKSGCTRADLMLYAMALGVDSKISVPLKKPLDGGFARTESFSPKVSALIEALHFSEVGYDNPDGLRDKNAAYKIAEEYANSGFNFIESDLDNMDSEEKANLIIADLNARYEKIFRE